MNVTLTLVSSVDRPLVVEIPDDTPPEEIRAAALAAMDDADDGVSLCHHCSRHMNPPDEWRPSSIEVDGYPELCGDVKPGEW